MDILIMETETKMETAFEALLKRFSRTRTGRANVSALDDIAIDYYGATTPIKQLCNISIPEPRLIVVQPWDKTALDLIEKAILASNIGVNPQNDGNVIRLPFQPLTEEIRKDIVKEIKKMSEEGKIEIRNVRRMSNDTAKKMQKNNEISEDEQKLVMNEIQELTNTWIEKITLATKTKEVEVMEV